MKKSWKNIRITARNHHDRWTKKTQAVSQSSTMGKALEGRQVTLMTHGLPHSWATRLSKHKTAIFKAEASSPTKKTPSTTIIMESHPN